MNRFEFLDFIHQKKNVQFNINKDFIFGLEFSHPKLIKLGLQLESYTDSKTIHETFTNVRNDLIMSMMFSKENVPIIGDTNEKFKLQSFLVDYIGYVVEPKSCKMVIRLKKRVDILLEERINKFKGKK